MTDIWLEIAWINYSKAIVHGMIEGEEIEFVLTDEQRELVYDLNARHEAERIALLKGFINE